MDIFCLLYWNKLGPFIPHFLAKPFVKKECFPVFSEKQKEAVCSQIQSPFLFPGAWDNQTLKIKSGMFYEEILRFEIMSFTSCKSNLTSWVWNVSQLFLLQSILWKLQKEKSETLKTGRRRVTLFGHWDIHYRNRHLDSHFSGILLLARVGRENLPPLKKVHSRGRR